MHPAKRFYLHWTRTLHIYLSVFALVALFFFAATGFLLNHLEWFVPQKPMESTAKHELPPELFAEPLNELRIVERLRAHCGVVGLVDGEKPLDTDAETIRVSFKSPGRVMDVVITRETGQVEVKTSWSGVVARLTDLHKGHSGNGGVVWGLVVDGISILLLLISLTGFLLWLSLRRRLLVGLLALLAGSGALLVLYVLFVP
jgi:hypothetical protein